MHIRAAARGAGSRNRRITTRRGRAAMIEALESRQLLSVSNLIEGVGKTPGGSFVPADPHGAAGPNHVVNVVNSHIQWFTKSGVNQRSEALNSFFAPLGTNVESFVFDPKIIYDQYNDRFVVVALWLEQIADGDPVNESHSLIAVSDDADPNGTWYFQDIDTKVVINNEETWLDYPGLAVSPDAIYLTGNMFSFDFATTVPTAENAFGVAGTRLFIIPTNPLYAGGQSAVYPGGYDPVTALGLTPGVRVPGDEILLTLQPAHMYGTLPTGLGTFLTLDAGDDPVTGNDRLYIIRVDNPLGVPVFSSTTLDVGDISTRRFSGVPMPFSGSIIERFLANGENYPRLRANDPRILSAVWRDGNLYATQVVVPPEGQQDAGQITAHWYHIDTGTATAVTDPTLFDQGNIYGEELGVGVQTFFPAVSVNPRGDIAIGFSASGPLSFDNGQGTTPTSAPVYPGAYVTSRLASDPRGRDPVTGKFIGFTRAPEPVAVGGGFYVNPQEVGFGNYIQRWGDYSGISVDIDSSGNEIDAFWVYNKYAGAPTTTINGIPVTSEWLTRWGRFVPELLDLPAVGNLVWHDYNGNGIQEAGEPGLAGVVLRLVDLSGNVLQVTTSDINGRWYLQAQPTGGAVAGTTYRIIADISAASSIPGRGLFEGLTYSPVNQTTENRDSDFTRVPGNPFRAQTDPILFSAGLFNENVDLGLFNPFAKLTAVTPSVTENGPGAVTATSYTVTLYTGVLNDGRQHTLAELGLESPWEHRIYYTTVGTLPILPDFQVIPLPGASATPEVDFRARSVELITVPALQGSVTASLVPVLGDALPEGNENFQVLLLQPSDVFDFVNDNLPPGVPRTQLPLPDTVQFIRPEDRIVNVTIVDDDVAVVSVDAGPTVFEPGAGNVAYALFTIRLSVPNPLNVPVRVNYRLENGTATGGPESGEGIDFDNSAGSVDFAPGQLTKTVRIPVFGDFNGSEGNESFRLVVDSASGATVGTVAQRTATATIRNLRTKALQLSAKKSLSFRDNAGVLVTITLTGPGTGTLITTARGQGRGLSLSGTTERSVLTIRTDRGQANLGSIDIDGGLARLDAPTTNLSGNLTSSQAVRNLTLNYVSGANISLGATTGSDSVLVSLNISRIANSSITSETSIRTFTLGSWIDTGPEDFLNAPAIRTIHATGDFGASVQPSAGDLGTMTVGGVLKGSDILVTRTNDAGQEVGSIGTLTVGSLIDSTVTAARRIDRVTVRSLFSDSTIDAPRIGNLELGTVRNTSNSVLTAARADRINSVRWTFNGRTQTITDVDNPGPRGLDRDVDKNPRIILEIT